MGKHEIPEIDRRYCQSCGMPLRFDEENCFGTNSDNSKSKEFCHYCLKDGEYTVDVSMIEMVDIWVKYTKEYNKYSGTFYSPQELRSILNKRLPRLGRWRQRLETEGIHYKTINKITSYINKHLFEMLDMNTIIDMSSLSKFHFRRIFKSITGENLAGYIQRLRLEQIAHLLISTNFSLNQIVERTNYQTKFSLAKAFRKHFGISTSEYRKRYQQIHSDKKTKNEPEIKFVPTIHAVCIEVGNSYKNKVEYKSKWDQIILYAEQNELNGSYGKFISISLDDPLITPPEKCRFYLGVTIPEGIKSNLGTIQIPKGRYAIFKNTDNHSSLHELYRSIYEEWFPYSNYHPKSTISFEIYTNTQNAAKTADIQTEIYIPIEKKIQ